MKKTVFLILCLSGMWGGLLAQPADSIWYGAGEAYAQGRYQEALERYTRIHEQGLESAALYYNMGNCAFKLQQYAGAILWFERAKLLDPLNADILYNLDLANRFCLDKIDVLPAFFVQTWIRLVRDRFSADRWAWGALFFLAGTAALLLLFFFGRSRNGRRLAFVGALFAGLLCVGAFSFGWSQKVRQQHREYAVVFVPVASVKSAPDQQGKDLFIIHEGTKVRIMDQVGAWGRIELADGRQGWMEVKQVERI